MNRRSLWIGVWMALVLVGCASSGPVPEDNSSDRREEVARFFLNWALHGHSEQLGTFWKAERMRPTTRVIVRTSLVPRAILDTIDPRIQPTGECGWAMTRPVRDQCVHLVLDLVSEDEDRLVVLFGVVWDQTPGQGYRFSLSWAEGRMRVVDVSDRVVVSAY